MANALDLWHPVAAPPVVPYRYGLFSVVQPRNAELTLDGADEHWRLGVTWQTQNCHVMYSTQGACIDPDGIIYTNPLNVDDYCQVMQFDPFTVFTYNNDAVPGRTLEEHRQDTIDRFLAGEQAIVEEQVISNIANWSGLSNVDLSAYPLEIALGYLEQECARRSGNGGVIYMTRQAATLLWNNLRIEGGKLVTTVGTPVVAYGAKQPGSLSFPGSSTMYATGTPVMYRGDIDTREWAIDKSINRGSWIAQRDYVYGWDCFAISAIVNFDYGYTPPS